MEKSVHKIQFILQSDKPKANCKWRPNYS